MNGRLHVYQSQSASRRTKHVRSGVLACQHIPQMVFSSILRHTLGLRRLRSKYKFTFKRGQEQCQLTSYDSGDACHVVSINLPVLPLSQERTQRRDPHLEDHSAGPHVPAAKDSDGLVDESDSEGALAPAMLTIVVS